MIHTLEGLDYVVGWLVVLRYVLGNALGRFRLGYLARLLASLLPLTSSLPTY